jgi:signal transduction histidine kinase
MGGAIGVTSELGEGTTFTVELPADTAKVESARESIQEPVEN